VLAHGTNEEKGVPGICQTNHEDFRNKIGQERISPTTKGVGTDTGRKLSGGGQKGKQGKRKTGNDGFQRCHGHPLSRKSKIGGVGKTWREGICGDRQTLARKGKG